MNEAEGCQFVSSAQGKFENRIKVQDEQFMVTPCGPPDDQIEKNTYIKLTKGKWIHVMHSYDAKNLLTYINGVKAFECASSAIVRVGDLYFGNFFGTNSRASFKGYIDEIQLW